MYLFILPLSCQCAKPYNYSLGKSGVTLTYMALVVYGESHLTIEVKCSFDDLNVLGHVIHQ